MTKYFVLLLLAVTAFSCQKTLRNIDDYYPSLHLTAATIQADGTVLLEGEIIDEGAAPIEYIGFCCNTNPNPELLDRQVWAEVNGRNFSATMSGFSPDEVYYFKAWATNEYGYRFSTDTIVLSGISAANIDPPCALSLNTCSIGGGQPEDQYFSASAIEDYGSLGYWNLDAATWSGPSVNFRFGSAPATGIYKTSGSTSPGSKEIFISFQSGFISGSLEPGSNVYVKRLEPGKFEISICDAPWIYGSSVFYFNTRLVTPL